MVTASYMAARFRLRETLDAASISQSEFARLADLSFATVHRICTNATAQVSLETLDKMLTALEAKGLKASLEAVIERDTPKRRRVR